MYKVYNFIPKKKPLAEDEPEPVEIRARIEHINPNGEISIIYEPPIAQVHDVWHEIFHEEEREKLGERMQEEFEKFAKHALNITFIKHSVEKDQAAMNYTLIDFSESGIKL